MARPTENTKMVGSLIVGALLAVVGWIVHAVLDYPVARWLAANGFQF